MIRSLRVWVLASLFVPPAVSAYCENRPSVAEEFENSPLVFVAKVKSQRKVSDGDELKYMGGTDYEMTVRRTFRGGNLERITLFSENSSGRFPMRVGESYLVFASIAHGLVPGKAVFAVNNCGNSGRTREDRRKVREVEKLARLLPNPAFKRTDAGGADLLVDRTLRALAPSA
jgi:hypothetical protein